MACTTLCILPLPVGYNFLCIVTCVWTILAKTRKQTKNSNQILSFTQFSSKRQETQNSNGLNKTGIYSLPAQVKSGGAGGAGSESSRVQTPLVSLSAIIPQAADGHPPGSIFQTTIRGRDRGAENSRVRSGYLLGKVIRAAKCFFAESHCLEFSHMVMPSCPEGKGNVSWGWRPTSASLGVREFHQAGFSLWVPQLPSPGTFFSQAREEPATRDTINYKERQPWPPEPELTKVKAPRDSHGLWLLFNTFLLGTPGRVRPMWLPTSQNSHL